MEGFVERLQFVVDLGFDTQLEACYLLGISGPGQLRRYFRGLGSPSYEVLASILRKGFSVDWLMEGLGSIFTPNENGETMRRRFAVQYVRQKRNLKECPEELLDLVLAEEKRVREEEEGSIPSKPTTRAKSRSKD